MSSIRTSRTVFDSQRVRKFLYSGDVSDPKQTERRFTRSGDDFTARTIQQSLVTDLHEHRCPANMTRQTESNARSVNRESFNKTWIAASRRERVETWGETSTLEAIHRLSGVLVLTLENYQNGKKRPFEYFCLDISRILYAFNIHISWSLVAQVSIINKKK